MSKFRVNSDHGFIGIGGVPVLLAEGDEYDGDHDLVKARPELFDEVVEVPKRPVLSRGLKGKPSDD